MITLLLSYASVMAAARSALCPGRRNTISCHSYTLHLLLKWLLHSGVHCLGMRMADNTGCLTCTRGIIQSISMFRASSTVDALRWVLTCDTNISTVCAHFHRSSQSSMNESFYKPLEAYSITVSYCPSAFSPRWPWKLSLLTMMSV